MLIIAAIHRPLISLPVKVIHEDNDLCQSRSTPPKGLRLNISDSRDLFMPDALKQLILIWSD